MDLRVRHEKLSLMHEIDALGSQARDLHMRHESWQAYIHRVTPLYGLYGNVPPDRIWFLSYLSYTGYTIL